MKKDIKQNYVYVNFIGNSFPYIYSAPFECKKGNVVEVPVSNNPAKQQAVVVKTVKLSDKKLPIEKSKILDVSKIIAPKYKNSALCPLNFLKANIDKNLLKEWSEHFKNSWVKSWKSTFDYTLSYEKDGVLEVFYYNEKTEEIFSTYTITSPKNLKIKTNFAKTIVSKLFHKIISEEEFNILFNKI